MGTLSTLFTFKGSMGTDTELPNIFSMPISQTEFIKIDIETIYSKILTDVLERTHGLEEKHIELLWDNCLMSSSNEGLITRLSKAMSDKAEMFLVYKKEVGVVKIATSDEAKQIREDYEKKAESTVGIYLSFKNYQKADMVRFYSGMEYNTICSLNKMQNLAKSLQVKMNDLRGSTGANDSEEVIEQAKKLAQALGKGKDILLDVKDLIETAKIDLTSTKESITFIDAKRSFYLGMPLSYITGEQTGGIGSSGENDQKAIERGLRAYYFSVVKPVLEKLFGVKLTYKSQDFRQITQALSAMQTFDLTGEEYVNKENKKKIIEALLDIDPKTNKTIEAKPPLIPPVVTP